MISKRKIRRVAPVPTYPFRTNCTDVYSESMQRESFPHLQKAAVGKIPTRGLDEPLQENSRIRLTLCFTFSIFGH